MSDDRNPSDAQALEQAAQVEAQTETNRRAVTAAAGDAMAALSAIVAADDATVAANAGRHIKTLARAARLLLRLQLGRFEGTT